MGKRQKPKKREHKGASKASSADKHKLYELAVQSPDTEVEFLQTTYAAIRGGKPTLLREDFCGTACAATEWVRVSSRHRAVAVDIDAEVLEWGRENNIARLERGAQKRIELMCDDVRTVQTPRADIAVAFNFSYWVFKQRDELRGYFSRVRESLAPDGLFFLDVFGGSEAYEECSEETKLDGFTYVWDQDYFDPITADFRCHIHFRFPDGSRMDRAFSYEWRLWTMPEIRELLGEAGFRRSSVYWETEDEDGEGSGEYERAEHGEADPAWIAYVVAEP